MKRLVSGKYVTQGRACDSRMGKEKASSEFAGNLKLGAPLDGESCDGVLSLPRSLIQVRSQAVFISHDGTRTSERAVAATHWRTSQYCAYEVFRMDHCPASTRGRLVMGPSAHRAAIRAACAASPAMNRLKLVASSKYRLVPNLAPAVGSLRMSAASEYNSS